jgi:hypothetical protein
MTSSGDSGKLPDDSTEETDRSWVGALLMAATPFLLLLLFFAVERFLG